MTGLTPTHAQVIDCAGAVLDTLMPMHVWIDCDGIIRQTGPTFSKMAKAEGVCGQSVFDHLQIRRPKVATSAVDLPALAQKRLSLVFNRAPDILMRGSLAVLPGESGYLIDLSLGLSFARAVAEFNLTLGDFSPCDQTVELLYLHEANRSTMKLSRHLSERLDAARHEAERQAMTDAMTGLSNRRAMDQILQTCIDSEDQDFGLLHLDLDYFKQVNDTLGHAAGDAVLEHVGQVLRTEIRQSDVPGRVGGDEFLIIIRDCVSEEDLMAISRRLIREIERPVMHEGQECRISASIGISVSSHYVERPTLDAILADADMALYQAKRAGRGTFVLHHAIEQPNDVGRRSSDPVPRN